MVSSLDGHRLCRLCRKWLSERTIGDLAWMHSERTPLFVSLLVEEMRLRGGRRR